MRDAYGLDLGRHRDLTGRSKEPWVRRALLCLVALVPLLALVDVFGQGSTARSATGGGAKLTVTAPQALRGGLLFQTRIEIDAGRRIEHPVLALGAGWLDGMTLNTIEPSAPTQSWQNGSLRLAYTRLDAGSRMAVYIQYQVNPTTMERRNRTVTLLDGTHPLASVRDTVTVFP